MEFENKIINGDSIEVLPTLSNIDLIVTSPPYFNSAKKYQRGGGVHYSQDVGEPMYVIEDCSRALFDVLKDDGFYCLNLGFSYGETGVMRPFYIAQRLLRQGWFCVDTIIWHKNNPIPLQNRLTNAFEYIFVFAKHPLTKYPNDIGYKHNVFQSSIAKSSVRCSAPFPEELPRFCIEVFSKENDIVLDCFNGSGTTCKVAKQMKRRFVGIDINKDYCLIAENRINKKCLIGGKDES